MSATIATLPRAGGNGAALVVVVADLLRAFFAAMTEKAAPKEVSVSKVEAEEIGAVSLAQLYQLSAGSDSISPRVAARLREESVA